SATGHNLAEAEGPQGSQTQTERQWPDRPVKRVFEKVELQSEGVVDHDPENGQPNVEYPENQSETGHLAGVSAEQDRSHHDRSPRDVGRRVERVGIQKPVDQPGTAVRDRPPDD